MKNTLTSLTRYLTKWKKYRGVWKVDKVSVVIEEECGRYPVDKINEIVTKAKLTSCKWD